MAAVLMAAGTKGKRTLLPNSRILIHQPWLSGLQGQQSDIEIHAKDMWMLRDRMDEILAFHTGKSKEEVHKDTERDRILSAPEALDYGLADRLMSRRGPGSGSGPGPIGAIGPGGAIGPTGPIAPAGAPSGSGRTGGDGR
jgi:ATP-dependent Clp protease protease subunit